MNAVLAFWIDRDTRTSMVCRSIWKHGCLNMSRCIPCDAMTTKKPHFTIFHAQNQRAVLLRFIWLQSWCIAFTLNDNVFNRHLELFAKIGTWIIHYIEDPLLSFKASVPAQSKFMHNWSYGLFQKGCGKEVYRAKLSKSFEGRTFGQVWGKSLLFRIRVHDDNSACL
jgi:hypothetical protein